MPSGPPSPPLRPPSPWRLAPAFKLLYPESVRLNRGNHESELMNAAFGFADEVPPTFQSL